MFVVLHMSKGHSHRRETEGRLLLNKKILKTGINHTVNVAVGSNRKLCQLQCLKIHQCNNYFYRQHRKGNLKINLKTVIVKMHFRQTNSKGIMVSSFNGIDLNKQQHY